MERRISETGLGNIEAKIALQYFRSFDRKKDAILFMRSAGPKGAALLLYAAKGAGAVRDFAKGFYQSKAWLDTRQAYAASVGWLCEDCLSRGLYVPGKVVHHVTPLTPENIKDPSVALSWDNLRLVCQDCHAAEHRQKNGRRYEVMPDGTVVMK